MSTTSTAPEVLDSLLLVIADAISIPVVEAWAGFDGQYEMVVFSDSEWDEYQFANVKAGRKHRDEEYSIEFEIVRLNAEGTSPGDPKASRDRVFEIFGLIEDVFAVDPTGGTDFSTVHWITPRIRGCGPRKFETGYGYRLAGSFDVKARLT